MPKLLHVTTSAQTLAHFLSPFGTHFRKLGWVVDGMAQGALASANCRQAFDTVHEINWSRNPFDWRNATQAVARVREVADRGGYDIVHVHTPVAAWVSRYALRNRLRKPIMVYTAHGFHFYEGGSLVRNGIFRTLERVAGYWTDYLILINHCDKEAAVSHKIVPADRAVYMPGIGVDTAAFDRSHIDQTQIERVRSELGLLADDPFFLMVAEFIPRKRHADLLHAFSTIANKKAHLGFAGTGRNEESLRQLANRLRIADHVHFLGPRADVAQLMSASLATILPSQHEGLSRSVLESLCLGVPVIGSDVRGIKDLVENDAGLLFPRGDRRALSKALDWIINNPAQAIRMGKTGKQKMAAYDLKNILRLHEQLYGNALAQ